MTLEICPTCGIQDSIYVDHHPVVGLDGKLIGGRTEAFCNNTQCDQRYWFFPISGRVTRRNTGDTYQKRHGYDLPAVGEAGPESLNMASDPGDQLVEGGIAAPLKAAWYWVRAFFVVYVPGFRRFAAR